MNICSVCGIVLSMEQDISLFLIVTLNVLVLINTCVIIIALIIMSLILNKANIQILDIWKYLGELEVVIKESSNMLQTIWWAGRKV